MNDANRESIMKMLAEGTLRPEDAARLLARMTEEEQAAAKVRAHDKATADAKDRAEKAKPATEKIAIPGADGTDRVIEVPSSLVPMITKMVGEALKQHTQKVAKETAIGFRNMVLNKYDEVRDTIKTSITGGGKKAKPEEKPKLAPVEDKQFAARRQILQMVQNGRITVVAAGRLIQELDALHAFEKKQGEPGEADPQPGNKMQPGSKKRT